MTSPDWIAAHRARTEQVAAGLGIGLEAAALIVELHDLAQAFHRVADAMQHPRRYVLKREESADGLFDGSETFVFEPLPDAHHDA